MIMADTPMESPHSISGDRLAEPPKIHRKNAFRDSAHVFKNAIRRELS